MTEVDMLLAIALCRALLGIVFAVAVVGKLRRFTAFTTTLTAFGWVPARFRTSLAFVVVAVECLIVGLVAVPATVPFGFLLAAVTLAAFSLAVLQSLRTGGSVRCECFGADGGEMGAPQLVRNGVLLAVATTGAALTVSGPAGSTNLPGLATGLVAGLVITRWDDLVYLLRTGS
ncbi:hypothetical protein GCM10010399_22020 [Dactylosporangium fulvum]|uniref:Methylamine utilisation protein MauE domain-containing protein n=1 Tax=Dactylosporangium fulvum TaxID=53359 RepID=A0ABY5W6A0_9ACTN|nr:MauE/DoxX family redox-associated membrane protein [Dactylosporangium fulvum]UWP85597.1 hypothetical protein Dfulv_15670 [Dactylosporangium fulvum]